MEETPMSEYCWKLTASELEKLGEQGLIYFHQIDKILETSRKRKPDTFAKEVVRFYLNKAQTIWVQSINYYGGENFKEPYHFLAEIKHTTTNSAFSSFFNKYSLPKRIAFTY
jgi:hypothetical protein